MSVPLKVTGVTLRFGGLTVARDIALELPVGARTALIGPNGAGKSTLVNLISGVLKPETGRIDLLGEDVTRLSAVKRVHRGLVRSFQVTRLFPDMTVAEHVTLAVLAREKRTGRMWRAAMDQADVADEVAAHTARFGLHRLGALPVAEIAYGQQRLVEFAIALAMRPRVLLLDEPAAGIPRDGMALVTAALDELPDDLAVMLIDHDMDLVRRFARDVVVMDSGEIVASGPPDRIARDPRVRSAYLGA